MSKARFFLASASAPTDLGRTGEAAPLRLQGDDLEHARALRLQPGDACEGLDGSGRRWPLEVAEVGRRVVELRFAGPPLTEPAPGAPGASLPWIEIAVAWPRRNRAEPMLGALVQLGTAAITALEPRFRGPERIPATPTERWERLARVALAQSGRTWLPRLQGATGLEDLVRDRAQGQLAWLDPAAGMSCDTWLRSLTPGPDGPHGTQERPIVLILGPEGGWAPEERSLLLEAGATSVWLGPHVLRIETAALAAMAVAATTLGSPDVRQS